MEGIRDEGGKYKGERVDLRRDRRIINFEHFFYPKNLHNLRRTHTHTHTHTHNRNLWGHDNYVENIGFVELNVIRKGVGDRGKGE